MVFVRSVSGNPRTISYLKRKHSYFLKPAFENLENAQKIKLAMVDKYADHFVFSGYTTVVSS